jgi:hypothetical protein
LCVLPVLRPVCMRLRLYMCVAQCCLCPYPASPPPRGPAQVDAKREVVAAKIAALEAVEPKTYHTRQAVLKERSKYTEVLLMSRANYCCFVLQNHVKAMRVPRWKCGKPKIWVRGVSCSCKPASLQQQPSSPWRFTSTRATLV